MKRLVIIYCLILNSYSFLYSQSLIHFKVSGDKIMGIKGEREKTMFEALKLFEKVMNEKEFQKELANFPFMFDSGNDPNRVLSSNEIASKILEGREFYQNKIDNNANINWIIQKKRKPLFSRYPAIGYGNENDIEIYTYTWFFDNSTFDKIAGHVAHEWSHKLGFKHQFNPHSERDKTVPYALGDLVTKYSKKYLDE